MAIPGLLLVGFMSEERAPSPRPKCRSLMGVQIISTGSYVPDQVITNAALEEQFGCDADWIVKRTGILERRHAWPYQATSDLAFEAGNRCLKKANIKPKDVDLLVLGTFTPDMSFPSTACLLQDRLGLNCAAIEIEAACAGFMYALITGAAYVASGVSDNALIIGADCNSRVLNPKDIKTFPLFGDGAGAVLLTKGSTNQGIISFSMGADGGGGDLLSRPACGSRMVPTPENIAQGLHYMHMDGRAVFAGPLLSFATPSKMFLPIAILPPNKLTSTSHTKPTSGSSTQRSMCFTSPAPKYLIILKSMATLRVDLSPSHWTKHFQRSDLKKGTR